ncbi:PadR family transcriptional regulator [Candidatus Palauibacter sp.]|uniref:PadR family transcriptional regulator n=1 Tax=Candidatus Palauibacter sp. TaxID=3101350 RepID=UPI003C6EE599
MDEIPRLSKKEAVILHLLVNQGSMYGLEMIRASDELKRGTVYVTLGRMAGKGYVESNLEDAPEGGVARRVYQATGHGKRVLSFWERMRSLAPSWGTV